MNKQLLLAALSFIVFSTQAQNVGIGTNDPKSKLDIQGNISLREGSALALSNGNNDNIALTGNFSFYRITGPTAAFSINGIVPVSGADGQLVTLVNTTTQILTIKNEAASSTAANRFTVAGGSDLVSVAGGSSVTIQYNKTISRWYVTASQNFIAPSNGVANISVTAPITTSGGANPTIGLGIVPVSNGGTGLTAIAAGQIAIGNGGNTYVNTTISSGTGINVVSGAGSITVNNTAPDQTVTLTGGGINSVSGSYPNFTITGTEADGSVSNEGALTVGAGTASTSVINSNTSGSTPVTLQAGSNVTLTESGNTITIASANPGGTVTQVNTGAGLTGGPITTTGTISMPNVGTAGTYGSATQVPVLTTDAQGRVTGVTNTTITGVTPGAHTHDAADVVSGEFNRARVREMISKDTRSTNPDPQSFNPAVSADFKQNSTNGLADGGTYNGVLSFRPYGGGGDFSGGPMHQLGFTDAGNLWMRTSTGVSSWGSWKKYLSSTDINGTTNYVTKFTSANTIGNSQIYDNGTSVGIGETSPNAPLTIKAASTGDQALFQTWRYQANSDQYTLKLKQTVTSGVVRYTYDMINNNTAYNNVLTLDRGNVGIGTVNPASSLDIQSASSTPFFMRSSTSESDIQYEVPSGSWQVGTNASGNGTSGNQFYVYGNGTGYVATFQAGTGNVGIGTTSPGQTLELLRDNADVGIRFHDPNTAWYSMGIDYSDGSKFKINNGGNIGDADHFTMESNGYVGIGTNDPTTNLDVNGTVRVRGGSPAADKLLASTDANGNAVWSNAVRVKPATESFTVGGDGSTFYPVVFTDVAWSDGPMELEIVRSNVHQDFTWWGSLQAKFRSHATQWGHGSTFINSEIYYGTRQFIARYEYNYYSTEFVVWLRGGGTTYTIRSNNTTRVTNYAASSKTLYNSVVVNPQTTIESYVQDNGTRLEGNLNITGKFKSNGINETSDSTFKKQVTEITDALQKVKQLRGVSYLWKKDEFPEMHFDNDRQLGVIAQEVEKIFPEVVETDRGGYKSVEYGHLVPVLIQAIKEQQAKIEKLEQNLNTKTEEQQQLKTQLADTQTDINALKAAVKSLEFYIKTSENK